VGRPGRGGAWAALLICCALAAPAQKAPSTSAVAIYYDGPAQPLAEGFLDAHQIQNLLGHFGLSGEIFRVTPIAVVSASRLTRELGLISEFGLNRSRSDVVAGAAISLRPGWSVFANTGRSFGRMDLNSSRYQVTFGLSFNVRLWEEK
jgi:hypothetical protein